MKRHLSTIAAIIIAVAGTAFSLENKEKLTPNSETGFSINRSFVYEEVWEFKGGDPFDPNSYERGFWQPSCIGVGVVCCIMAEEDIYNPGHPDITPYLQFEISLALDFCIETNNVKLKFE